MKTAHEIMEQLERAKDFLYEIGRQYSINNNHRRAIDAVGEAIDFIYAEGTNNSVNTEHKWVEKYWEREKDMKYVYVCEHCGMRKVETLGCARYHQTLSVQPIGEKQRLVDEVPPCGTRPEQDASET